MGIKTEIKWGTNRKNKGENKLRENLMSINKRWKLLVTNATKLKLSKPFEIKNRRLLKVKPKKYRIVPAKNKILAININFFPGD